MVDSKGSSLSQAQFRAVAIATPKRPAVPPAAKPAPQGSHAQGPDAKPEPSGDRPVPAPPSRKPEIGGPKGPEPTRYGDWEKGGRCIDF